MARGDGKAVKGRTRAVSPKKAAPKARFTKSGVRKMAIGGNPGDMATGGFGTGMSGVAGSVNGNRAAGNTGSNFGGGRDVGGGGGNARDRGPATAMAAAKSAQGQLARLGDLPAAAMTQAGIDSGRAQMMSGIMNNMAQPGFDKLTPGGKIADRIAPDPSGNSYRPFSAAPPSKPIPSNAPVAPSGASPAGMLARLGSLPAEAMTQAGMPSTRAQMMADIYNRQQFGPGAPDTFRNDAYGRPAVTQQPGMTRPGFKPGVEDMASIKPGYMSWTQGQQFTPFAQTQTGQDLLAASKKPLTQAEALALKSKFPANSAFWADSGLASLRYPAPSNPGSFDQYPATIDGYNFTVGVPKGAGVNRPVGPKVGTWNEGPAPSSPTSVAKAPGAVVSPASDRAPSRNQNFSAGPTPGGREGGNREQSRNPRKKKPSASSETKSTMKNGGAVRRIDGAATRGKTKGRYI